MNILFHLARKAENPAAKKWALADFQDSLIAELCDAAATAQAVPRQIPQNIKGFSCLSPATQIMESEKKDRNCRVCSRPEKRKRTTNVCATCPGRPYLCKKPCFKVWHTKTNLCPAPNPPKHQRFELPFSCYPDHGVREERPQLPRLQPTGKEKAHDKRMRNMPWQAIPVQEALLQGVAHQDKPINKAVGALDMNERVDVLWAQISQMKTDEGGPAISSTGFHYEGSSVHSPQQAQSMKCATAVSSTGMFCCSRISTQCKSVEKEILCTLLGAEPSRNQLVRIIQSCYGEKRSVPALTRNPLALDFKRRIGCHMTKGRRLLDALDMPPPVSVTMSSIFRDKIRLATESIAKESMERAADELRKVEGDNVTVSCDEFLQRRGFGKIMGHSLYAHYPKQRLLEKKDEAEFQSLSKLKVSNKMLRQQVIDSHGKNLRLKDVSNIKSRARAKVDEMQSELKEQQRPVADCLLGMNVLQHVPNLGLGTDGAHIARRHLVRIKGPDNVVPAGTVQNIAVTCCNPGQVCDVLVEPASQPARAGLFLMPTFARVEKGQTIVPVVNTTREDVILRPRSILGTATSATSESAWISPGSDGGGVW
ncbi:hypothetical protein EGW08_001150 [Elysia chlorotica]|uniref:PiggyBac transposable element-derived protein 4 C-terminal zinc-finger domain-containing protein n=1 Tax=Elysia chlorotica TaxID=188477 RepID=A0A3S1BXB3_ELYCH|nr:hypothetical protein EGW08_001150 [Elysia chlorotica]